MHEDLATLHETIRRLEHALQQHSRFQRLVESVPGVVWEAWGQPDEQSQNIDYVSDYIESMLGYTTEEWLTTPNFWLKIVPESYRAQAGRDVARIFAGGKGGTHQFPWQTKDGRILWVESHSTVICNADGIPIGMRGVTLDITDRKFVEEKNQQLTQEIERQVSTLDELSTPLIPILDHVLVMPLIGAMDTQRIKNIIDALLQGVMHHQARIAIIDITGIPVVDSQVAMGFVHAAQGVQLLGARVIVTGIRPEIAQTLVGLGLNLDGLTTRSTLQMGVATALSWLK
ncbi:MAG TPA: PAS domain-containing protein [Herpetosiphonaceae bacterium]|nr:PAS domain-containing protein [Herpetosiphonaceae bacterium]